MITDYSYIQNKDDVRKPHERCICKRLNSHGFLSNYHYEIRYQRLTTDPMDDVEIDLYDSYTTQEPEQPSSEESSSLVLKDNEYHPKFNPVVGTCFCCGITVCKRNRFFCADCGVALCSDCVVLENNSYCDEEDLTCFLCRAQPMDKNVCYYHDVKNNKWDSYRRRNVDPRAMCFDTV
jgi:hypothetical protein